METPQATVIRYERPAEINTVKTLVRLVRDEHMTASVQILTEGGENNLHSHKNMDGLWFVLGGKVKFYTTDNELLGEFGKGEGMFIPRNFPYWFESSGDEPLEILQAEAIDRSVVLGAEGERVDYEPVKKSFSNFTRVGDNPA